MGEQAEECAVGDAEELAQFCAEFLGLEDGVEGVDIGDVVCSHEGAMEDNIFPCVLFGVMGPPAGVGAWGVFTWACGDVIHTRLELVRVIHIEALGNG